MTKVSVVIPTCRDLSFLEKWRETDLVNQHLIIVEDKPSPVCEIPKDYDITRYCHEDIDRELGEDASWIIARQDGGIKSFGILKAYQQKAETIICLDDDTAPLVDNFVQAHEVNLAVPVINSCWMNSLSSGEVFVRGVPYSERTPKEVVFNMGLWKGIADLDAPTAILHRDENFDDQLLTDTAVPEGCFFSHCVMNVAIKRKAVPAFYQLLMGDRWGMYRFDDIWSGLFLKKCTDYMGHAVTIGEPYVQHNKASNLQKNLEREEKGMGLHENFWRYIKDVEMCGGDYIQAYNCLAGHVTTYGHNNKIPYFEKLGEAMNIWLDLLE